MSPSMSPENAHGQGATSSCEGPTLDMQILRDLFRSTIKASRIWSKDHGLRLEMEAFLPQLRPDRVGSTGHLQEWEEDWDETVVDLEHRHVSHLYGLYPSAQISLTTTPHLANAAIRTLNTRGDLGPGWSTAWKVNLWARLRDGERSYSLLCRLLSPELCLQNMFDAHPPLDKYSLSCFQIDGNLGGTAGIAEMLLHSHDNETFLLPALTAAWPDGAIVGLRAHGGWTIDLKWQASAIEHIKVVGLRAGRLTLHFGQLQRAIYCSPGEVVLLEAGTFFREPFARDHFL